MISKKYLSFSLIFIFLLIIPASATERLCDVSFEDCRASLIQLINQETVGLDVAFWFMDDTTIASAVINKAKTVPVRILMDPRATKTQPGNGPVLASLQSAGIPMRQRLTSGILHWKTMIFAGQGIVEFSGANFSRSEYLPYTPYANYTDEAIYFSDDPSIFNSFRTKYDDWWTDTVSYTNYANITTLARSYPTYPIDPSLDLLPVSGSNAWQYDYGTRSMMAMNAEKVKLDIDMFRVTNTIITDNTIKLFAKGLPIRMIIDQSEYRDPTRVWNSYNMDRLFVAGIPMKITVHQGQNHEKVLLLYGQGETIFGSSNWSLQSFNKQQEHNIFTKKPWFFQWFVNQFERRWDSNTEYAAFVPLGPGAPTYVSPATASVGQSLNPTLTWNGGRFAQTYDVYFGITSNPPMIATSVVGGTPTNAPATQPNSLYKMAALTPGTTYYWKVVSKTAAGVTATGPVWSFTTTTTPPVGGATVTSVTPNTGADSGGTAVTISGTNFGASPKVSFGNILASKIVLVNSTTITAVTPPHVGGGADVTVSSAAGGSGTLPAGYTYTTTPVNTALQVNLVSPATGSPTGGDSITITGNNILSGAKVTFGGVAATVTGTGKNAIHVTTPAGATGPVDVVLTNPNGQFVTVKGGFTYTNPAGPPNVSSVSPNSGSLNGGSSVTINGSGFAFGAVVTIGGNTATTITVMPGGNVITATAPSHAIGLADVVVTNRDGQTSTLSGSYNYTTAPAPSISSVAPSAGTVNGGAGVTISGANFVYGASVTIGGRPAMVQTVTGTYINAVTPTGQSTGASDVIVTNPDGQSQTLTGGYTYQ